MPSDDEVLHLAGGNLAGSALAKVDELHDIIDRAAGRLADVDCHQLAVDLGRIEAGEVGLADRIILALDAVLDARAILAEAEPEDLEGERG